MIVTIDGPAGAGKSSVARELAKRLGFHFLDTGAMYRAVAWAAMQANVDFEQPTHVEHVASKIMIVFTDHSVIVDIEATRSIRQAEVGAAQTMIDRTEERFGIKPDWLVADTAYGSAEHLAWLTKKRGIIPFIPLIDKSDRKDGTFSRSDFEWDEDNDRYTCPEGQHLLQSRRNYSDPRRKEPKTGRRRYRATKAICDACPSKSKCINSSMFSAPKTPPAHERTSLWT